MPDINFGAVKTALLHANQMAVTEAERIKKNPFGDTSFFEHHIRNYVLYKFRIHNPRCEADSLKTLADESVARLIRLEGSELHYKDTVTKCDGMTSSGTKISLLFLAIQTDFNLKFPVEKIACIDTVAELASVIRDIISAQAGIYSSENQTAE